MPERSHPLAARAAAAPACAAVQLALVPPLTRISLRAAADAAAALGDAFGIALPTVPCNSNGLPDRAALWLGPDEWLVLAKQDVALPAAIPGASVVDVSHGFTGVMVSGPRAAQAINAFCALDLDATVFPIGMCTRTLFGKAQIVLWRIDTDAFHLEVARSFAPYVWDLLEEVRREFMV